MDKHCRICHNTSCSNHGKNISFLGDGWKCNYIPAPTKADRIRSMSDEELAKFLNWCEAMGYEDSSIATDSSGHCMDMLEWLKQPAE